MTTKAVLENNAALLRNSEELQRLMATMPHGYQVRGINRRMPRPSVTRLAPPTHASALGMWTREPRAGAKLFIAGESGGIFKLGNPRTRADRLVRWLGDLPKQVRDAVVADVTKSTDNNRDEHISKWLLSNERVDSYDTTLAWDGWMLGDFRRNPVVLLAHDSYVDKALPIGEDIGVFMDPTRQALMGLTRYASQELAGPETLEARAIRWILAGLLRACSVGFEPVEWVVAEDRDTGDSWFVPVDFIRQILREYSITPVPANPDSLQDGRAFAGMKPAEVERFAADIENMLDGAGWLALPRATLEQMRGAIRGTRMQVEVGGSSFVVMRADDVNADPTAPNPPTGDEKTDAEDELADQGEEMKCPACGFIAPENDFVMNGNPARATPTALSDGDVAALALLPTEMLAAELHRRHHVSRSTRATAEPAPAVATAEPVRTLDVTIEAGKAAVNARAAQVAAEVNRVLDARAAGRLP